MQEQNRLCMLFLASSFLFALLGLVPGMPKTDRFAEICLTISSTLASASVIKQNADNNNLT